MKKIKLLAPLLGVTAIAGMITPIVTSCNKNTKQEYKIKFSDQCAYAFKSNVSRIRKGHDLFATISCTDFCILQGPELVGEIRCGRKTLKYNEDYLYYMSGYEESKQFNLEIKAESITDDIVIDVQNIKNIIPVLINGQIDESYRYRTYLDGNEARYFEPEKLTVGIHTIKVVTDIDSGHAIPNALYYGNVQYKWNSDVAEHRELAAGEWQYALLPDAPLPTWNETTIQFYVKEQIPNKAINISVVHRVDPAEFAFMPATGYWIDGKEQRQDLDPELHAITTTGVGGVNFFAHSIGITLDPSLLPTEATGYKIQNIYFYFTTLGEAVSNDHYKAEISVDRLQASITFTQAFYVHLMSHPSDQIKIEVQIAE